MSEAAESATPAVAEPNVTGVPAVFIVAAVAAAMVLSSLATLVLLNSLGS